MTDGKRFDRVRRIWYICLRVWIWYVEEHQIERLSLSETIFKTLNAIDLFTSEVDDNAIIGLWISAQKVRTICLLHVAVWSPNLWWMSVSERGVFCSGWIWSTSFSSSGALVKNVSRKMSWGIFWRRSLSPFVMMVLSPLGECTLLRSIHLFSLALLPYSAFFVQSYSTLAFFRALLSWNCL